MYFKMCQNVLLRAIIVRCDMPRVAVCRPLLHSCKWLFKSLTAYIMISHRDVF